MKIYKARTIEEQWMPKAEYRIAKKQFIERLDSASYEYYCVLLRAIEYCDFILSSDAEENELT
jgi:hypothetical protein